MSFTPRTLRDGAELAGWRVADERLLRDGTGGLMWLLDAPRRRTWSATGVLELGEPPAWSLQDGEGGALLRCADAEAEVDAVEMRGELGRAFERDASEPLTVIPSFRALGGPDDLGHYLVGGRVVTGGPRARWQVEQAALSIYRIARVRGGAFWEAVAEHLAQVVARRVEEAPGGRPVTDHWGKGEVHARFVADAALLLSAHGDPLCGRAADAVESFAVPFGGGLWYLHDSVEQQAGRNDLVLNTHLHALTALLACGRDVEPGLRALEAALAPRARGPRGALAGYALAGTDIVRAFAPRGRGRRASARAHARLARVAERQRALRIPAGYVARDASGAPAPSTYLAVNLSDLAVLQRNRPTSMAAAALAHGLAYARRFAHMRAELHDERPAVQVLMPHALRNAGRERAAARAAALARRHGLAPIVGWPGYEDELWSRLARGTP
jgi:hypothetical protein